MEGGAKIPLQQLVDQGENGAISGDSDGGAAAGGASSWRDRCKHSFSRAQTSLKRIKTALRPYFIDEDEEELASGEEPLNGGVNPLVSSYMRPGEHKCKKRFFLAMVVVTAGCAWWVGPLVGIFVADPMIQLLLSNIQVITSRTDCFDHRLAVQTCEDAGVRSRYYFHNITNVDEWLAGTAPPSTVEVGPYSFVSLETRYNVNYTKDWNQVAFTYHTWDTFDPDNSCPTCTMSDTLTVINRGYIQFYTAMRRMTAALSNPDEPPALPEEQVKVILMPMTLADVAGRLYGAAVALGSLDPAGDALRQWVNCGMMRALTSDTDFFLPTNASDPQGITYAPELCYFISTALQAATSAPDPVPPTAFAGLGFDLPLGAAGAWLSAAIGTTSPAGIDPAAQAFVTRFLLLTRATNLAYLASADPSLHDALEPLTDDQWNMLKGYLASLLPTYSSGTYSLFMAFGGAQIIAAEVQRVAARWTAMAAPTPEQAMVYTLLPLAVRTMLDVVTYQAMLPQVEAGFRADPALAGLPPDQPLPADVQAQAVGMAGALAIQQWTDCSVLGGAALPVGPGAFPHAPEFCAFLTANADSLGFSFAVTPAMLPELGLVISQPAATAFLGAVAGASSATSSDPFAQSVIQTFMMAPSKAAALAWLGAQGGASAGQAADMASLTDLQFRSLQLYLISLLPSWGKLVYTTWIHVGQAGPGAGGLVVTRTVEQLLYGYEDPILVTSAQLSNPQYYRLAPYMYSPYTSLSFQTEAYPVEYFANVTGANYTFSMLSYKSTDVAAFEPRIQHKRIVTGKRKGDWPQSALQYRGIPFYTKPYGILNATGINEGIIQGSNFKPSRGREPIQFESSLMRSVKTVSTESYIRVKKVRAYQMTLHPESYGECNATQYEEWKAATGFDEQAFQATMAALTALKQDSPAAYWQLMQDEEALTTYFNGTDLGPLDKYFGADQGAWLARCTNPEPIPFAWDLSDVYGCPTIISLARYYRSSEEVINATGRADWDSNFAAHGWYFSVEPNTGMSIHGHKTFQWSQLVTRTDVAYPSLWVANGSQGTPLGRALGMDADFVLVPLNTVVLYWEPTWKVALVLRGVATAKEVLYWLLVVAFPVSSWLQLFPALIYLKFSKYAKLRKKELAKIQKSTAKRLRLGGHEAAMADALYRLANGSKSVFVPPERDYTPSDTEEEAEEAAAGEQAAGTDALAAKQEGGERRGSRMDVIDSKAAAAAAAQRQQAGQDAFVIGTAPQPESDVWGGGYSAGAGAQAAGSGAGASQGEQGDAVAVTLLPPGEALSAAAPASFRRSTTGGGGGLRKRTTSTQEGP